MKCVAEFTLTATLGAFSGGRESFLIYLEVLDDTSCGRHFHFHTRMAHWRQGRKRATSRQKSSCWNVDETRDRLHGQPHALCRIFLEAFIGARVRCTHGEAPQQPCRWFSVARMRRRMSGVAGDVPCEPPPFCFTPWHLLRCENRSHWPSSVTREPPVLLSAALQSREEGLRVR
ncbi:hypothetical protein TcCL_NonESM09110 [Trypanosoma cruzi]|nr:hypothetical protein TcCL_NonESM09110 [Trypanosoma cruzi]